MDNDTPVMARAFLGPRCIACGALPQLARQVAELLAPAERARVRIFDDQSGKSFEVDFGGSADEVAARLEIPERGPAPARGPGRPKLGVVAREVTLLPRHWAWLNAQPGGTSVALRKLVEDARRQPDRQNQQREAREACYGFMSAMAGNFQGFEDATRALFAGQKDAFLTLTAHWPADIAAFAFKLAQAAFD